MKNLFLKSFVIILTMLPLAACDVELYLPDCIEGEGEIVERTLDIPAFKGVDLSGSHNIVIQQGAVQEVRAVGQSNIIDHLNREVYDDVWKSGLCDGCFRNYDLTIYVTVPDLNQVKISGSGTISVGDFENQDYLKAEISGSGRIILNTFTGTDFLQANITGSGDIVANKNFPDIEEVRISVTGSGNFNGFPIKSKSCKASLSGSGNCSISVGNTLNAYISGSGNIYYMGNPSIEKQITGMGKVIHSY